MQSSSADFAGAWSKLSSRYKEEAQRRTTFNREHFRPFGDVTRDGFGGWHADGNALSDGPSPSGEFAVASSGPRAIAGVFPAALYSHALPQRPNFRLRSPLVPKDE